MHEGVADDIGDDLAQAVLVAVDDDRRRLDVDGDRTPGRRRPGVGSGVAGERRKVDRSDVERALLVELGQRQHVLDEASHPRRLLLGAAHRVVEGGLVAQPAEAVQLGVAADRRDRRAQLVRCVGDEAAQARLGGGALVEGTGEVTEHRVEGDRQVARFSARRRLRNPYIDVAGGDAAGGLGHLA